MSALIAGIGQTAYSKNSGQTEEALAVEAILSALGDAGLTTADVDGIIKYGWDHVGEDTLMDRLGIEHLNYWGEVGRGGAAAGGAPALAATAIEAGLAKCIIVFRTHNGRSGVRYGRGDRLLDYDGTVARASGDGVVGGALTAPYGLLSYGQMTALRARRYMADHAISDERMALALGAVATTQRAYAQNNPNALMRDRPMTLEDYLGSRVISEPMRIYDFCLESDGAAAMIITSDEFASSIPQPAVRIMAQSHFLSDGRSMYRGDISVGPQLDAPGLFARAGIAPSDIDVMGALDPFSLLVPFALEGFGFCGPGESVDFLIEGGNRLGGALPTNTSGGLLSEAYCHGMPIVLEVVRQLRGQSCNQVEGAELAFLTAGGVSSLVLGRN